MDDDADRLRAEMRAEMGPFRFGAPVDRSRVLDEAAARVSAIFGYPCIAQYSLDGKRIDVTPAFYGPPTGFNGRRA